MRLHAGKLHRDLGLLIDALHAMKVLAAFLWRTCNPIFNPTGLAFRGWLHV
jgi:hypothetical protein